MFRLFIICIFLVSLSASATVGFQLGTGGFTPHFSKTKKNYCNQWNNTGIIVNKSYYVRLLLGDIGLTYMVGNDSICSEIEGVFFNYTMKQYDYWDIGVTVGGYAYNVENWEEHAAKTPSGIDAPQPFTIEYFDRAVVPVLALDVGLHLIRRDNWSLKLNNLLTPIVTNHSIAYEYRF